jgi:hypothetical protein
MCWWPQTSGYSYPRVTAIGIDVHHAGKIDQHATLFPCSVCIWPQTIHISCGQRITTFHIVINRFEQVHYSQEEGLPTQPTAHWLTGPRVHTQLLSHNNQWSSGKKPSFCSQPATRLTEPISPACDRYIQYLFTRANPSVVNWQRWGLQPWRCWLATSQSPTFPTNGLPLSTLGPRPVVDVS